MGNFLSGITLTNRFASRDLSVIHGSLAIRYMVNLMHFLNYATSFFKKVFFLFKKIAQNRKMI